MPPIDDTGLAPSGYSYAAGMSLDNPNSPYNNWQWGNVAGSQYGQSQPASSGLNPSGLSTPQSNGAIAGGLVGSAVGMAAGLGQTLWAGHQLKELNAQPTPNYSISPELQSAYGDALSNKNIGLTNEEKSGFQTNVNRAGATNMYNAQHMAGGNMSVALQGAVSANNATAYDNLAAIDADTRRKNLQDYYNMSGQMQHQRNMISQQNINYRMMQEQMYGQALNAGLSNLTRGAQDVGAAAGGLI
ncbi:MAG: hypothetical protein ACYDHY_19115 [Acidiferrobacterales bacterium]